MKKYINIDTEKKVIRISYLPTKIKNIIWLVMSTATILSFIYLLCNPFFHDGLNGVGDVKALQGSIDYYIWYLGYFLNSF